MRNLRVPFIVLYYCVSPSHYINCNHSHKLSSLVKYDTPSPPPLKSIIYFKSANTVDLIFFYYIFGTHNRTRKSQKWYFARKTIGATDLKLGMYIQLHSRSNMGWIPPGHTSSFSCVRLKMPKMVYQEKHLNLSS